MKEAARRPLLVLHDPGIAGRCSLLLRGVAHRAGGFARGLELAGLRIGLGLSLALFPGRARRLVAAGPTRGRRAGTFAGGGEVVRLRVGLGLGLALLTGLVRRAG